MKVAAAVLALALEAAAFPRVLDTLNSLEERTAPNSASCTTSKLCNTVVNISNKQAGIPNGKGNALQQASAARDNCGAVNFCTTFSASDQLVSVSGNYKYIHPAVGQIRGPCPGLNAAANHNYLPRSGVPTILQTITGLGALYNMGPDLAGFLAAYAVAIDGDPTTLAWSIGGPPPAGLLGGVTGAGQGISYSHNKYEGDSSIGRCDAYINNGDAHSLSLTRFNYAYQAGQPADRYTFDIFSREFTKNTYRSEAQNPHYFAPLFSTTLVSPAAYNFVIAFMSNHTAQEVGGYLDGSIFKEFFAVSGNPGSFVWNKGQERVPNNWYRRPTTSQYQAAGGVFGDLIPEFLAYPNSFRFGGNTGKTNSYVGVNLTDLTGGVYDNSGDLFTNGGAGFKCLIYQSLQQAIPDALNAGGVLAPYLASFLGAVTGCPAIDFNDNQLNKYPGHTYNPTGAAETC